MSPYEQAKAVIKIAKQRMQTAGDYHTVYNMAEGERMILDMLRESGVLSVAHVSGDPGTSAFNDGKRAMGLYLIGKLRWSEGQLVKLARMQTADELNEGEG